MHLVMYAGASEVKANVSNYCNDSFFWITIMVANIILCCSVNF